MARRSVSLPAPARDALEMLGAQIRLARHQRGWTVAELAERIGVSDPTVIAVESGSPGTAVGTVLTAATLVGVPLFGAEDRDELARMRRRGEERLALISSRVRRGSDDADRDDDFAF